MRKRVSLLVIIVLMCIFVALSGSVTFLTSNSVLKIISKGSPIKTTDDVKILVDVRENRLYLMNGSQVLKVYPIASGKLSTPSPIGDWKIIQMQKWGEGFGGYWMGLNVPWGKYGIHGTTNPGSIGAAASHGCIRMNNKDVREVYNIVTFGTQIKIVGDPFGAFGYGLRVLKPGDRGADVYYIQKKLKQLGYFQGYENGIYGDATKAAVHKFQRDHNLKPSNVIGYSFYNKLGIFLFD